MNENKKELLEISKDIRDTLQIRRNELELSFIEDTHTYYMRNTLGEIKSDFPSVSTVIKQFYEEFPALEKSLSMCNGDIFEQDKLLTQWRGTSEYANSKGSRTHYLLEADLLKMYGSYKEVRQPIFECDDDQIKESNSMIDAGHKFIQLMHRRGAVLLDTEIVLGSPELGYTGQPDKVWLTMNAKGDEFGILITDWKTNKEKNFQTTKYTESMYTPFEEYPNNALGHYYLQLPFYGKLLLKMLEGTKYENIKLLGSIVVLLKDDTTYQEFRVPKPVIETIMGMDTKTFLESDK